MSPQAKRHVGTCGACRRFYDLCRSYPAVLKREMNREIDLEREPDFSVPADRSAKRRRFVIWAAAAALAVGVASPIAYRVHSISRIRAYIRTDNSRFIEDLLGTGVLDTGNGFLTDSRWFRGADAVSDFLAGSPLFSEEAE